MSTKTPTSESVSLSDVERHLIDKYLRSDGLQLTAAQGRIPRRPPGEPIPLSSSQQQVWVHSQMAGSIPIYNESVTICRRGPLDVAVLRRCLAEISRRHEICRTTFDTLDGKPVQLVQPNCERFPLKTIDLRHLPEPERLKETMCLAAQNARRPFDLKKGPLLAAVLIRQSDEEYRLYVTFHQIIFDAASVYRIFLPELATLYGAFSASEPSPLSEPILQYGDFAYWQQKTVATDQWADQLSFWRKKLSGELPLLDWGNERARPPFQTHRGAVERFELDPELVVSLKSFSRQERVSTYMTCLAGYAALLSRYTGQKDVIIGGLSAGRRRSEVEGVFGYFVNPLALRIDLSGNPTFRELTHQVRNTVLDALANEEIPFENVVEALQLKPDPSRNPLFQIIVSQQPKLAMVGSGWELVTEEVSNGGSKLDVTIVLDERSDGISGPITYNPDLFSPSTIVQMVDHWRTVLRGAFTDPDRHISELPLLTQFERQQILVDWNRTEVGYPKDQCLHELVDTQAKRTPAAVALIFEGQRVTYLELNTRSNKLADYLRRLGVGPEIPVGLYLEPCFEAIVGLLGTLKAGGTCLALDPAYPKDRVAFMLAETQAPVLLTKANLAAELPLNSARVICLDSEPPVGSTSEAPIPVRPVGPDNLAYIVYTSGSVGRPNGVQITHHSLVNSTLARCSYYRDPVRSFLLVSSFAFDSSLAGIFWTLSTGGALVLTADQARRDPALLVDLIIQNRISHILCVPSLYRQLLDQANLVRGSCLAVAIVAGEECSRELVDRHYRLLPQTVLFNEYGPTEGTVWSSVYRCDPQTGSKDIPIGRPIENTRLYVLDEGLQPMPVGVPGELHIAGAGIARGYLNRPGLNEVKFIANPFGDKPEDGRLYKSGDLVRYLPDGNLVYLGRVDHQVKIRGFRVEIGEIETTLRACPGVRTAVVTVREDSSGDKRLVAYVEPEPEKELTADRLRAELKLRLPQYMVPTNFVLLKALPLSPNGKIDRRALPAPEQSDRARDPEYLAPGDDWELRLTNIWEEILGIRNIGIKHNLFDLGAHSLLISRVLTRIEREFGRRLSFASVFGAPTIEQLAAMLRNALAAPSSFTQLVPIQPVGSKPPFFCIGHRIGGGFFFRPLSEHLGPEQPVIGIEFDPAVAEQLQIPFPLEKLAGYMAQAIRAQQPEGPYFLGGFCENGTMAYETARQLLHQGQQVGLLAIFDARNPSYPPDYFNLPPSGLHRKRGVLLLRKVWRVTRAVAYRYVKTGLQDLWLELCIHTSNLFARDARKQANRPRDVDEMFMLAVERYRPKRFSGRVALFRADTKMDPDLSGWRDVITGPLEVHEVPGNHMGMFFDPHVSYLARLLATSIREAGAPAPRGNDNK